MNDTQVNIPNNETSKHLSVECKYAENVKRFSVAGVFSLSSLVPMIYILTTFFSDEVHFIKVPSDFLRHLLSISICKQT